MTNIERLLCDAVRRNLEVGGRPKVPAGGELLWTWFGELCSGRTWGAFGPNPLSLTEIEAYRRMSGWPIEERHVRILRAMDDAFRRYGSGDAAPSAGAQTPITAKMFDAVFG